MKGLIYSLVHSLIFQILSLASLLQRGFKLLQCNVNEERSSTEVSSTMEQEQHGWRNSSTSLNVPTMESMHSLECIWWGRIEVKFCLTQATNPMDSLSLQLVWAEESAAEGTWRMDICLIGTECETRSRTVSCMLRFPVYCLKSIVHLRHENLNITMIP